MSGEEEKRRDYELMTHMSRNIETLLVKQAVIGEKVSSIETQAKKTNGRVNDLEDTQEEMKKNHQNLKDDHNAIKNQVIGIAITVSGICGLITIVISLIKH